MGTLGFGICRVRTIAAWLLILVAMTPVGDVAAEQGQASNLRVAVYDVPPYGALGTDGLFSGASVDLWRRVAEERGWPYRLTAVASMEAILAGLEHHVYDVAIGAITITPERLARVDFSYPAHRSGVAAASIKDTSLASTIASYGQVVTDLGSLITLILVLLVLIGVVIWIVERPRLAGLAADSSESSVSTLLEGIYWAVVTMTTVGYGDKTPKTQVGRFIAVAWMLGSVALVSLLSTNLVSRLTAERVENGAADPAVDLTGKRLAAVTDSSGAEYLDGQHLGFQKYGTLQEALDSLIGGKSDAVVNSIGALQYLVARQYSSKVALPHGIIAPAYMAFALQPNSALKKQIDTALIKITASPEWRSVEQSYFGR